MVVDVRNSFCLTVWVFLALCTCSAEIIIVQGSGSCPNTAERNAAAVAASRWERWLGDLGLTARVVKDEDFGAGLLGLGRISVLPYNPNLPAKELAELRSFMAHGGRLVVCYSADEKLADIMGVRLGPYIAAGRSGRWEAYRFLELAPPHIPDLVRQPARNIRPPISDSQTSWTVAVWQDGNGSIQPEAACVKARGGYWFSHILSDDADAWRTRQMIAAVLGSLDPAAWPVVARRVVKRAGTVDMFASFDIASKWIVSNAQDSRSAGRARALLAEADMLYVAMADLAAKRDYGTMMELCGRLDALLFDAYAASVSVRKNEFRGVWARPGSGPEPSEWNRMAPLLSQSGFTDVFVYSLSPAISWCFSGQIPVAPIVRERGDYLESALKACRARGLRVHAWISCFNLDGASEGIIADFRRKGRLQVSDTGKIVPWLCPSQERNIVLVKDAVRDLLRRYDVDGLHLDYIRYENNHVCYCGQCRQGFEGASGRTFANWPADVMKGEIRKDYLLWRRRRIESLVRDVATFARRERPGIIISAAVFGKYPTCADSVGQDWAAWARAGYVDLVCPMNYTTDMARFEEYVVSQERLAEGRVIAGIGVAARESRLNPAQVIEQIRIARRAGAKGFALFELNRGLVNEIFPRLAMGATSHE